MDSNTIMMTVASILILVSAALYFAATVLGNAKKKGSSGNESSNEVLMELKKQNALIQSQMEKLEREIRVFSGKQENQAKTIIKYNKENARQLALSERDTLMRVMQELKKAIEHNAGSVATKEAPVAAAVMEEVSDAELFEVSELPADEEMVSVQEESMMGMPSLDELITAEEPEVSGEPDLSSLFAGMTEEEEVPAMEEPIMEDLFAAEIPEETEAAEDLDLSSLFAGMAEEEEVPAMAESMMEDLFAAEIPETSETPEFSDELDLSSLFAEMEKEQMPVLAAEEPAKAANDPLAGFGSDPNAMMTPEDIAKLLEAMG